MTLLLLRHVDAGDRGAGDDRRRPISPTGLRQAVGLVTALAEHDVVRILASPYTRCVQSVEPLAAERDLVVEEVDELGEGTPLDAVDRLLRRSAPADGAAVVLCTHGDVLGDVVEHLGASGVELPAGRLRLEKGGTWVLDGPVDDPVVNYLPPPA